jgi:predicted DNA-binding transcriptional regulator
MAGSKATGITLMITAFIIALIYLIGLVIAPDTPVGGGLTLADVLVRYTILVFMLIIAGVIGYIGYIIFTSPTPRPIEEIVKEYKEYTKS